MVRGREAEIHILSNNQCHFSCKVSKKVCVLSNSKCHFPAKLAKMFGEAPKRCEDVPFFSWATVSFLLYLSSLAAHKMPHDRQIYP